MRRLPLSAMYMGKSKGRTLRPMGDAAAKLAKNDSTVAEANLLRKYESKCKLAHRFSEKLLPATPYEDCKSVLTMLVEEKCEVPPEILSTIIEKRVGVLVKTGSLGDIVNLLNPWAEYVPLDPINPVVASLPKANSNMKESLMSRLLFKRCLVPQLMEGQEKEALMRTLVSKALVEFGAIDVLELTDEQANTLDSSLTALRAVMAVLTLDFSEENMQALETIKVASEKKLTKSIESNVGCAIEASPYYRPRMEMGLKAKVQLIQHGSYLKEMCATIPKLNAGGVETTNALMEMCSKYGVVLQCLPSELTEKTTKLFMDALSGHWKVLEVSAKSTEDSDATCLTSVLDLYKAAYDLFPSSDDLATTRATIQGIMSTKSVKSKQDEARVAFEAMHHTAFCEADEAKRETLVKAALSAMDAAAGIEYNDTTINMMHDATMGNIDFMTEGIEHGEAKQLSEQLLNLWARVLEIKSKDLPQKAYELQRVLGSYKVKYDSVMKERAAAPDLGLTASVRDLDGHLSRLSVKLRDFRSVLPNPARASLVNLEGLALKLVDSGRELVQASTATETSSKSKAFEEIYTVLAELPGAQPDGQPWWADTAGDADIQDLQAKSDKLFGKFTVPELRKMGEKLRTTKQQYEEVLRVSGAAAMPEAFAHVEDLQKKVTSIAGAMQLIHLLGQGDAPGPGLRTKVQVEVRSLRAAGLKEKEVLPESLYKMAYEALTKGAK